MTLSQVPPLWKEAPFVRLLLPFSAGIVLQQNANIDQQFIFVFTAVISFCLLFFQFRKLFTKFKFGWITGLLINLLLVCIGFLICEIKDESRHSESIINLYSAPSSLQLILLEPLIEKEKSYKTIASVEFIGSNDALIRTRGKVILYFSKDSANLRLGYGSCIISEKLLSPIRNSGNPGAFDYRLYCERQGIYHSVYLTANDYHLLPRTEKQPFKNFLLNTREEVLEILSEYIEGNRESGLAKALLIGYKDELDEALVNAYANTGVVHIIAISGLHLGIIFWILSVVIIPLQKKLHSRWPSAILILLGLWLFSVLAGAGPSVLRSAFMFSIIVLGNTISKNSNVYNNLAFSAFALLCHNPYWLWDAGFQLSYTAVLSIVVFFKPIYNWFYIHNKILDFAWKLTAVTLAAQVLTLPISIYHFHQLPVYFLLSNLLAVPLSSVILLCEILLCAVSFLPGAAMLIGVGLQWLIQILNIYIENINQLPFAVWEQLQISFIQLLLLFVAIAGVGSWTMQKQTKGLIVGLCGLFLFACMRFYSFYISSYQEKLIVYNAPNAQAIDFISGRNSLYVGDRFLLNNSYVIKPSRTQNRIRQDDSNEGVLKSGMLYHFGGKTILIVERPMEFAHRSTSIDVVILSKNAKVQLPSLIQHLSPGIIIADASNSASRSASWEKICTYHGTNFHNIRNAGAFVLSLR